MMQRSVFFSLVVIALLAAAPAPSTAQAQRPRCDSCGRFIDTSPARMNVTINYRNHDRNFQTCSVFCLCEYLEDCPDYELKHVRIRDYTSALEKDARFVNAFKAVFLSGVEADEQKTSQPFIFAFANETTAKERQQELGGQLLKWEDAFALCQQAAAEYEPNQPQSIHPPKRH